MDLMVTGNDKCRNVLLEKSRYGLCPLLRGEVVQICMLHVTDHLDSVRSEVVIISCKLQAGTRNVCHAYPS